MGSLYDKPVRLLMYDMVADLAIKAGDTFSRDEVKSWFGQKYPKIKEGTITAHLGRMSVNARSRIHYNTKPGEDDLFFQIDSSLFRLYDKGNDPTPIYPGTAKADHVEDADEGVEGGEFAYEKDLQNFLAKNLELIEPGLILYEDEGINGIEFPVGGRFIDILALDADGNYVVIELKVSRGYDRVIGQLLRYVSWIREHHAEEGQRVRGIICAREISEDLLLACHGLPDVSLFEYSLSVSLKRVQL